MIRILHVVEPAKGGVPLFVRRLCEGMGEGFSFDIACRSDSELNRASPIGATVLLVRMSRQIHPVKDHLPPCGYARWLDPNGTTSCI